MAKIALRVYTREIAELVDHGQIDESIAHCRQILKTYPKHVETYRLLGKAYLEGQRYGDASDILQRVLSSVPDDFIAHVGMSLIREDEGNPDAAIWHMERAFEIQPSNQAIQSELRRLFGKRDGVEPAKIRLTRGALARMYAHGNLYEQSIGELHAALAEDRQRPDLQVLLARMYYEARKFAEAAEAASRLLNILPFCLEAHRLLVLILRREKRQNEANAHMDQLQSLDPYAMHITESMPYPSSVADQFVMVDRLEWQPTYEGRGAGQPSWASSLGVQVESSQASEPLPDWLMAAQEDSGFGETPSEPAPAIDDSPFGAPLGISTPAAEDWSLSEEEELPPIFESADSRKTAGLGGNGESREPSASSWLSDLVNESADSGQSLTSDESDIPDFMRDASWEPSPGLAEDSGSPFEEPVAEPPALEKADVPDWLKDMQPGETSEQPPTMDWPAPSQPQAEPASTGNTDWLKDLQAQQEREEPSGMDWSSSKPQAEPASTGNTDWLKELQPKEGFEQPAGMDWPKASEPQAPSASTGLTDWLKELGQPQNEPASEPQGSADMGWLDSLSSSSAVEQDIPAMGDSEGKSADDSMAWLDSLTSAAEEERPAPATSQMENAGLQPEGEDDSMAWLESLAAKHGAAEDELLTAPEDRPQEPPTWLQAGLGAAALGVSSMAQQESYMSTPTDRPDDSEESMDWLNKLSGSRSESAGDFGEESSEEDVDWLKGLKSETEAESPGGLEESMPTLEQGEGAMAWLENLAAKQGVSEEELVTSPEERQETPPDWLGQLSQARQLEPVAEIPADPTPAAETDPMDWLNELESLEAELSAATVDSAAEEVPEWLQPPSRAERAATEEETQELPNWLAQPLEAEAEEPPAKKKRTPPAESDVPEWLRATPTYSDEPAADESAEPEWLPSIEEVEPLEPSRASVAAEWMKETEAAAPAPRKKKPAAPKQSPRKREKGLVEEAPAQDLYLARQALNSHNLEEALEWYSKLIKRGRFLDEIIDDLKAALRKHPVDIALWQALGDAYLQAEELQKALDSYTKAEELLQ